MNLIDRYINEVGRRLPRKQREDVKMELRSLLEDTLEDRTGGNPTPEDVEELLLEFGSPEKVAASYQPGGEYLVSPEMFPFFKIVLGAVALAVTIGLGIAFFMGAIFQASGDSSIWQSIASFFGAYVQAILTAMGSIVILFFILQRLGVQPQLDDESEWKPKQLPDVKDFDLVGRGESIAGVAFSAVILVLLNVFADRLGIVVSWGDEPLLNNIVQDNLVILNIAIILGLGLNLILLWQGRWNLYTRVVKLVGDIFWLVILSRMVGGLKDGKDVLVSAGLVDPLPSLFLAMGYFIIGAVAISMVVNTVKVILNMLELELGTLSIKLN